MRFGGGGYETYTSQSTLGDEALVELDAAAKGLRSKKHFTSM